MQWRHGYIAVDWGTTNRRAYAIGADGRLEEILQDDRGILAVGAAGFDAAIVELRARFDARPLLLAGMIGSNRGWVEVPYVRCPAGPADLAGAIHWVRPDIGILPGVSYRCEEDDIADVMRGEEVQVAGALATGLLPEDGIICHPGTHTKWILIEGGSISAFRTLMTGELFSLLQKHSILADQIDAPVAEGPTFAQGAAHALAENDLLAALFSIRARSLLDGPALEEPASYASGLLIGSDVAFGLRFARDRPIALLGRSDLTLLYQAALALVGRDCVRTDGANAFLAGVKAILERV